MNRTAAEYRVAGLADYDGSLAGLESLLMACCIIGHSICKVPKIPKTAIGSRHVDQFSQIQRPARHTFRQASNLAGRIDPARQNVLPKIARMMLARRASHDSRSEWKDDLEAPRKEALAVSHAIRDLRRPPAIMLHGVMRRSGTNFVGDLLGLHPHICRYPGEVWEAPLLSASADLLEAQETFLNGYKPNRERFGQTDFLPLFGSAFLAYLHSHAPPEQRILLKIPGVEQIWHFPHMFPEEKLIILERDGRDLVASTIKSWPKTDFEEICHAWKNSQGLILKFREHPSSSGTCFVKYEDAVGEPKAFVARVFGELGIDDEDYPYESVDDLPVRGSSALRVDGKVTWDEVSKPKSFNPIGRWGEWSMQQKTVFKRIGGEMLIRAGYADDLNW